MNKKIFALVLFFMFSNQLSAMQWRGVKKGDKEEGRPLITQEDDQESKRFTNLGYMDSVLFSAVINGCHSVVRMLLRLRLANVGATDNFENTPLHYAALLGDWRTVRVLLDHGANTQAYNCHGNSPEDLAMVSREEVRCTDGDTKSFDDTIESFVIRVKIE